MVLRAVAGEKMYNRGGPGAGGTARLIELIPACRPTDYFHSMVIAVPYDIAARLNESPHNVDMAGCHGPVQRMGVVALLARVHI
jgi:hypothetical protein